MQDSYSQKLKKAKLEVDLYTRILGNSQDEKNAVVQIAGVNAMAEIPTTKTLMLDSLSEKEKLKQKGLLGKEHKERPRRHPARLGRRKIRELSKLDNEDFTFEDMQVLNRMWCEYIAALWAGKSQKLSDEFVCSTILHADFVGSLMHVVESKSPEWVGKSGIVLMETMHTFKWISQDNRKMTVLKESCVFMIQVGGFTIRLFGRQLVCRPGERSVKTFKGVPSIEL
jgi:RNase P/RNase MRP subunit p29